MELDWGFGWTDQLSRLINELNNTQAAEIHGHGTTWPPGNSVLPHPLQPCFPPWPKGGPLRQELGTYSSHWMQEVFAPAPEPRLRLSLLPQSGIAGAYLWIQLFPREMAKDELYLFFTLVSAWYQAQRSWALEPWAPEALALPLRSEAYYGLLLPVQTPSSAENWVREFPSLGLWYVTDFFSNSHGMIRGEVWLRPLSVTGFRGGVFFSEDAFRLAPESLRAVPFGQEQDLVSLACPMSLGPLSLCFGPHAPAGARVAFSSVLKLLSRHAQCHPAQGWRIPDDWSHEDLLDEFWFWQVEITDTWAAWESHHDATWRLAAYSIREPGLHYRRHHWKPAPDA